MCPEEGERMRNGVEPSSSGHRPDTSEIRHQRREILDVKEVNDSRFDPTKTGEKYEVWTGVTFFSEGSLTLLLRPNVPGAIRQQIDRSLARLRRFGSVVAPRARSQSRLPAFDLPRCPCLIMQACSRVVRRPPSLPATPRGPSS